MIRRPTQVFAALLALVAAVPIVAAGAKLVLKDGQTLVGTDVRRDGDVYTVTLSSGDVLSLPAAIVASVEITAEPAPASPTPSAPSPPPAPASDEGRPLSGPEIRPPRTADQLAAFGRAPAEFGRPAFDPHWKPESGFSELEKAEMKPHEWAKPTFDPTWKPESAYDTHADVLAKDRVEWKKPTFDPHWQPTDAYAR